MKIPVRLLLYTLLILSLSLSGCGLAEKADEVKQDLRTLSLILTQGISTDFNEIWVQLKKVEAVNANNERWQIYDNPQGKPINLVSSKSTAQLLNAVKLPSGKFEYIDVTFSPKIQVVNTQGLSFSYTFKNSSADYRTRLPANLDLIANKLASIAVSFDLTSFVPDELSQVTPALEVNTNIQSSINRIEAKLEGVVVSVSGNSLVIKPKDGSAQITVNLHNAAVILNEANGQVINSLSALSVNDTIEIYGNYNALRAEIEAIELTEVANPINFGNPTEVTGLTVKAEGNITAVSNDTITMDVKEASFIPDGNTIDVIDFANAVYLHGNQSMLSVGNEIEVKGKWDGQFLVASRIDIEGASRSDETSDSSELVEIEGTVQSFTNNELSLKITKAEHSSFTVGSVINVNMNNVWFKQGNSTCLTNGTRVQLKGDLSNADATSFKANQIEVEENCSTLPDDNSEEAQDSNDDSSEEDNDS